MLTRRDQLRSGAALPALSLPALPFARALEAAESPVLTIERFVFDVRFAESGAVADEMDRHGVALAPIADDLRTLC